MSNNGKVVVSNDEWPLSDIGFKKSPDAATFVTNIANWFLAGRDRSTGRFHAYSHSFGLTGSALAETMTKAGHSWSVGNKFKLDLETCLSYDGIFVGGSPPDNINVLIEYVKAGGNVYLMGGTGAGGDSHNEAAFWNPFLNAFDLEFKDQCNWISGNYKVYGPHPIFAGVKYLYQDNGLSIVDLKPCSKVNQVLINDPSGEGLYAIVDLSFLPQGTPQLAAR